MPAAVMRNKLRLQLETRFTDTNIPAAYGHIAFRLYAIPNITRAPFPLELHLGFFRGFLKNKDTNICDYTYLLLDKGKGETIYVPFKDTQYPEVYKLIKSIVHKQDKVSVDDLTPLVDAIGESEHWCFTPLRQWYLRATDRDETKKPAKQSRFQKIMDELKGES